MKNYLSQLNYKDYGIAAVSLVVLMACLSNGLTHTYDSQLYLAGSKHIEQYGFGNLFSSGTFRAKPPLYPLVLYILGNNEFLVSISHVTFYALSLLVVFVSINQLIFSQAYRLFAKIIIGMSTPLLMIQDFLLPESLFMLTWNFHLIVLFTLCQQPSRKLFCLLVLTSILMISLRHIGIVLVFISGLFTCLRFKNGSLKTFSFLNFIVPIGLFAGWQYALYLNVGHTKRLHHFSGLDITGNAQEVLLQFTKWFVPSTHILYLDIALTFCVLGILSYLVILALSQSSSSFMYFCAFLSTAFIGFIILKGDLIYSDIERYLSLIYLPMFLLITTGLGHFELRHNMGHYLMRSMLLIWLMYPCVRLIKNVTLWSGL